MSRKVVVFTGLPKSGRSGIVNSLCSNGEFEGFNIGEEMFKVAERTNHKKINPKLILNLSERELNLLATLAFDKVREAMAKTDKNIVIDTHSCFYNDSWFISGHGLDELAKVGPTCLFDVVVNPYRLWTVDRQGDHRFDSVDQICAWQSTELGLGKSFASLASQYTGKEVRFFPIPYVTPLTEVIKLIEGRAAAYVSYAIASADATLIAKTRSFVEKLRKRYEKLAIIDPSDLGNAAPTVKNGNHDMHMVRLEGLLVELCEMYIQYMPDHVKSTGSSMEKYIASRAGNTVLCLNHEDRYFDGIGENFKTEEDLIKRLDSFKGKY